MTYIMKNKQTQSMWETLFVVAIQFATKKQLIYLIRMFCLWIPCHKLYKESIFSYVLTLK